MPYSAGPNIAARPNLVFEYDTGDVQNSYKGIPVVNCATDLTSGYNITVTEVTDGSILPPFGGMRVYKFITTNASNLHRQGGYYDGGGFAGSNPRPLILGRTSPSNFTTVGTGKYRFGMYVRGDASNSAGAGLSIDIGDRNAVSANVGTSSTWQLIETNDSAGINDSSYPYDFFDIGASYPMTFYVAGYGIWRNIGTVDSLPALQGYPQGTQYITYGQTRSTTEGLLDVSGRGTLISLSNVSFTSTGQMTFDGTDDQINMDSYASVVPYGGSITVETLVQFNAFAPNDVVVAYGGNGTNKGFLLQYEFSSGLSFSVINVSTGGTAGIGTAASAAYVGKYTHMVGVYNQSQVILYLNGINVASANYTGGLPQDTTFRIGNEFARSYYSNMNLPVVRIYDSALSAQEVLRNYNQLKGRFNLI
jgi:hypothetical protein